MEADCHFCVYFVLSNSKSQYGAQELTWKLKFGAAVVDDLGRLGKGDDVIALKLHDLLVLR